MAQQIYKSPDLTTSIKSSVGGGACARASMCLWGKGGETATPISRVAPHPQILDCPLNNNVLCSLSPWHVPVAQSAAASPFLEHPSSRSESSGKFARGVADSRRDLAQAWSTTLRATHPRWRFCEPDGEFRLDPRVTLCTES
jgi:hypothetical protein